MRLIYAYLLGLILVTGTWANPSLRANEHAMQHAVWQGLPISFVIPVGKERILKFPSAVTLRNQNPKLTKDKVRILNNEGFLYIKAKKTFKAIRLPVKIKKTGEVVLIDVSTQKKGATTPLSVVLSSKKQDSNAHPKRHAAFINYVTLMRFAIQHLYAPKRLVRDKTALFRTPMQTTKSVHLLDDDAVLAMPLVSWQGGRLYVTAVLLKNIRDQRAKLDPRHLNGHWLAASFYPTNFVAPKGQNNDRTTLFLVSDRPFNQALHQINEVR